MNNDSATGKVHHTNNGSQHYLICSWRGTNYRLTGCFTFNNAGEEVAEYHAVKPNMGTGPDVAWGDEDGNWYTDKQVNAKAAWMEPVQWPAGSQEIPMSNEDIKDAFREQANEQAFAETPKGQFILFETGGAKWLQMDDQGRPPLYTSDRTTATVFHYDGVTLAEALQEAVVQAGAHQYTSTMVAHTLDGHEIGTSVSREVTDQPTLPPPSIEDEQFKAADRIATQATQRGWFEPDGRALVRKIRLRTAILEALRAERLNALLSAAQERK